MCRNGGECISWSANLKRSLNEFGDDLEDAGELHQNHPGDIRAERTGRSKRRQGYRKTALPLRFELEVLKMMNKAYDLR